MEQLLDINNFNKPKEVDNNMGIILMLVRLVLMNPGSSIMQPNMGVGLVKLWRYVSEDKLDELNTTIEEQISDYLPDALGATITCNMYENTSGSSIDKVLILTAKLDEDIYNIKIDTNGKYTITYTKLSDLK